jgi:hypothetical protein
MVEEGVERTHSGMPPVIFLGPRCLASPEMWVQPIATRYSEN